MGKVKEESPARTGGGSKPAASKPSGSKSAKGQLVPFFGNFLSTSTFKPLQGKQARLWTAVGLGVLVVAGLYSLSQYVLVDEPPMVRFAIPAAVAVVCTWLIWRLVQYPGFADFLIATEAEMNKVSWTTRDDLYRATIVVLVSVFLLTAYLFGVDLVWSWLLRIIGVLQFQGPTPEG
jgi:preprotein translocase subunit SecE